MAYARVFSAPLAGHLRAGCRAFHEKPDRFPGGWLRGSSTRPRRAGLAPAVEQPRRCRRDFPRGRKGPEAGPDFRRRIYPRPLVTTRRPMHAGAPAGSAAGPGPRLATFRPDLATPLERPGPCGDWPKSAAGSRISTRNSVVELDYGGHSALVSERPSAEISRWPEFRPPSNGAARGECELAVGHVPGGRARDRWRAFAEFEAGQNE